MRVVAVSGSDISYRCTISIARKSMLSSSQAAECYSTPTALDALVTKNFVLFNLKERRLPSDKDRVGPSVRTEMGDDCPLWSSRMAVIAVPANGLTSFASPQKAERFVAEGSRSLPVVRAGEVVQLWRRKAFCVLKLLRLSEEVVVWVRPFECDCYTGNRRSSQVPEQVSGVIRGPAKWRCSHEWN